MTLFQKQTISFERQKYKLIHTRRRLSRDLLLLRLFFLPLENYDDTFHNYHKLFENGFIKNERRGVMVFGSASRA